MVRKTVLLLAAIFLLAASYAAASQAERRQLGQVVYITVSKACSCTLERCQAGDIIIGNVFASPRKALLKRLDYSTEKEATRMYLKQYGITQAPALLFLDAQGKLLYMAMGELSEKEIQDNLRVLGN